MSWKRRGYSKPDTTFIYALCDPSGEVRYIGKSDNPRSRFSMHKSKVRRIMNRTMTASFVPSAKEHWLMTLFDADQEPELVILEECEFDVWFKREEYWREYYLSKGARLTNRKRNKGKGNLNKDYYKVARKLGRENRHRLDHWTWNQWRDLFPTNM